MKQSCFPVVKMTYVLRLQCCGTNGKAKNTATFSKEVHFKYVLIKWCSDKIISKYGIQKVNFSLANVYFTK